MAEIKSTSGSTFAQSTDSSISLHAAILNRLKALGRSITDECRKAGKPISPVLAAFTARVMSLEIKDTFTIESQSADSDRELVKVGFVLLFFVFGVCECVARTNTTHTNEHHTQVSVQRALSQNDPNYETIKMQVAFETMYARELEALKTAMLDEEKSTQTQLDKIVELGTNIQSSMQGLLSCVSCWRISLLCLFLFVLTCVLFCV